MKQFAASLLSLALLFSLTACGSSGGGNSSSTPPAEGNSSAAESEPEAPSEPAASASSQEQAAGGSGRTLVVYYSATNNTEAVAGYIAEATGGDLFELLPAEPYTSDDLDWTDRDSRVSREHDDEALRVVELENAVPDGWEDYDTVFVGYPIWWGIAAWPVDGFIATNDFTGKTVIPFCTSSSSGLGESGELLAEAAGTGDWLEGHRFPSRASEEDVQKWLSGLELG